MQILFIVPLNERYQTVVTAGRDALHTKLDVSKNIKKLYCVYPSGVLAIAAYVEAHLPEAEIKILDFNAFIHEFVKTPEELLEQVAFEDFVARALSTLGDFRPEIIGISALFSSVYHDLGPLAILLGNRYPGSLVTCGGHLATTLYARIFQDGLAIDAILYGEGEIPFVELAKAWLHGEASAYLEANPSWVTAAKCADSDFIPQNRVIFDLDEIPAYDLSMLVFPEAYFDSSSFLFMPERLGKKREMVFFSTRGCPYNCIFCASHQVHGKQVRMHSVERIKRDIDHYVKLYGVEKITFYDDHILIDKKRAIAIFDHIHERGLTASVINPAFFEINDEVAGAMRRAGVRSVILSIESGNAETFKRIVRKPSSLEKAAEAVNCLHRVGINAATNVLIGLPGETVESIEKGLEYLRTANFNWILCFVAAPLPGSDFYRICVENGYFVGSSDVLALDFKRCVVKTEGFAPEYIEYMAYEMNLQLNFLNNYDMRVGNWHTALMLFERILDNVLDSHAFACYFAAICCRKLGDDVKYQHYKNRYRTIIAEHPFWHEHAERLQLRDLD